MITKTIVVLLGYMCVAGFVVNGQVTCNSTAPCPGNLQCVMSSWGGSQCNWGTCGCASAGMKYFNTSTCVTPTVNLGGSCTFASDCKGTALTTTCNTTNICACYLPNYVPNSDNSDCIPGPRTPLNGNCTTTNPPCGAAASCISNNTCQCSANYIPVGGNNNVDCMAAPGTVAAGGTCNTSNNLLCASGLTCGKCPESSTTTCQAAATTTTPNPTGGASNVRLDIMALVTALAFFRFAA